MRTYVRTLRTPPKLRKATVRGREVNISPQSHGRTLYADAQQEQPPCTPHYMEIMVMRRESEEELTVGQGHARRREAPALDA